jgi:hypothetical protein
MSDNTENMTQSADVRTIAEDIMGVVERHRSKPAAIPMAAVAIVLGALIAASAGPEAAFINMVALVRSTARGPNAQ